MLKNPSKDVGEGSAMPDNESPSARYRRLARECITIASTIATEHAGLSLIEMAQIWTRLADSYDARPVMQQQQQIQSKDEDKKE
jgi:hypothetical protein